ncbi:carboxyltransferase domain-containing protein [Arthrobacter yangruifuii]|uniref:Carboxyltransferase domain-containing protein n=1 Tax=Arthrobacter yangruifuii TaxID=2606616 RepID=A0A5N6MFL9_9MICC|nr:carboxyltransferase domain-containing protein [Arthrobacter yangruifuii]KAD3514980.1 carboxyltransferase domain-containing protein [Arthrobacter yangruifuii]
MSRSVNAVESIRPAGTRSLLVELGSLADVVALHAELRARPLPGQLDVLAAAATVLVRFSGRRETVAAAGLLEALDYRHGEVPEARTVTIETVYDGADLADVARLTGLSEDAVIAAHSGTSWTGGFGGFAPGFTYLVGGDPVLKVPRRDTPRTAVPAGSVALAGDYSAVYPRESPGGWQLIGRTGAVMWDLARESPALVRPGDAVWFKPVRDLVEVPVGRGAAAGNPAADNPAADVAVRDAARDADAAGSRADGAALEIRSPGLQSLIEDLGRPGFADLGVSVSGAADLRSARQANRLVGNPAGAAVIENLFGGLELAARGDAVLALTGAELPAAVVSPDGTRDRPAPLNAPFALLDGEILTLGFPFRGIRSYVAVRGGIAVEPVLGSRSTDTMSGIGPPALDAGVRVPVGPVSGAVPVGDAEPSSLGALEDDGAHPRDDVSAGAGADGAGVGVDAGAGIGTSGGTRPGTLGTGTTPTLLRITAGPRQDWFGPAAADALANRTWSTTNESNRIGVRFAADPPDAQPLQRIRDGELASEGVVTGSLQVPPSGLPVLFLADHPVTGGYPVIAVVVPQDLPVAAQLPPSHPVRFVFVDPDSLAPLSAAETAAMFPEGTP